MGARAVTLLRSDVRAGHGRYANTSTRATFLGFGSLFITLQTQVWLDEPQSRWHKPALVPLRPPMPPSLLAPHAQRSDRDPDLDPDLEAAAAGLAMPTHPVTGAFTDPAHESAFAAQYFRLAYPGHFLLMAMATAIIFCTMLVLPPDLRAVWGLLTLCVTLCLVGRVQSSHVRP